MGIAILEPSPGVSRQESPKGGVRMAGFKAMSRTAPGTSQEGRFLGILEATYSVPGLTPRRMVSVSLPLFCLRMMG